MIFLWTNRADIHDIYKASENAKLLKKLASKSEEAYQIYLNDTPEKAIASLNRLIEILEDELEDFDDTNEWKFIDRSTINGDLSFAHGRLSIKYSELNDANKSKVHIQKALFYYKKYSNSIRSEEDIIKMLKKIDSDNLENSKVQR